MMTRRVISVVMVTIFAAVLGGCALFQPGINNQTPSNNEPLTLDEQYAKIAQSVPGFGGMFFDENNILNMYLTDQRQIAAAQAEIASVLGVSVPQANVRVLRGEYDFVQLK